MKVLGTRVLLKIIKETEVSVGGILLASEAVNQNLKCEVISVGKGMLLDSGVWVPLDVNIGDIVLVSRTAGADVRSENREESLMVVNEKEILVVY